MREPTVRQGKSAVFWVVVAIAGSCAVCSVLSFAVLGLGLVSASDPTLTAMKSTSLMPTGNTPDLFPGMPGWLPSGQGVLIPTAEEDDGEPRGLWWYSGLQGNTMIPVMTVFLADGTFASNPRLGGGTLFDLEGQRAQKGDNGLGTFSVAGEKIRQEHAGFKSRATLSFDSDEGGPFMMIGETKYWPLSVPTAAGLMGTWRTAGGKYIFRSDGTFESGHVDNEGAYTVAMGGQGLWMLDGYLLQVNPKGAPGRIMRIGATGDRFLVIDSRLYDRE